MYTLFRLLAYFKNYKTNIILASCYSFLNVVLDTMPEVILGVAIDTVVNRQNSFLSSWGFHSAHSQLFILSCITLVAYLLESIFEYLYSIEWGNLAQLVQHDLRIAAYKHTQNLDIQFFEEESSGVIINILVDDINLLEQFFNEGAHDLLDLTVGFILIFSIFLYVSPSIALFSSLPIPFIFVLSFYFRNKLNHCYDKLRKTAGELASILSNNLLGVTTIKNYTTEGYELNRLEKKSDQYLIESTQALRISSLFIPVVRIGILVGYLVTLVLGGFYALSGVIAVGAYSTLIFLTQRLLWPFTRIAKIVSRYQRSMASASRVLNLLATPIHINDGPAELKLDSVKGAITFDNVSFSYAPDLPVLNDISFTIPPKSTVAFVGQTGSGKTTITKLLLRYYDVTSGAIYLDGKNIKEFTLQSLRNAFGVVSQDVFLTEGTIEDNIRYGSFNASFDQVENAAKEAEAYSFIMQFPQQFKTRVGERGQKLSSGQKQRIVIARALLKNPPIFIFDEATSAVDNETERAIQHSLQTVAKEHTTIIIAHRLSTIRNADTIYVIDRGKIVDSGTHDELVKKGGSYSYLWKLQTGELV